MALITTDSIHKRYKSGLSTSPDFVEADKGGQVGGPLPRARTGRDGGSHAAGAGQDRRS